jgi:hypothetical protein
MEQSERREGEDRKRPLTRGGAVMGRKKEKPFDFLFVYCRKNSRDLEDSTFSGVLTLLPVRSHGRFADLPFE